MTSITSGKNRRQHERYDIASVGFALLQTNDTEVLGSIKDISTGGLSLSHIGDNEELSELSKISIYLIAEKTCYEQFSGRNIWSKKEESGLMTAMVKMTRRGIEFEQLNNEMRTESYQFIGSLNKK